MKIRKLKIKNYKVFDDVEFDFTDKDGNTLDTIVLAGMNGSGKTTVLELIRSIFDLSFFYPEFHPNMKLEEGCEICIEYDFSKEER
ncbi:MAG: AAA family ATPase, partial [Chitinophagales bacterium]